MVLDTSAVIAILQQEPEAAEFATKIAASRTRLISAVSVLEAGIVAESRSGSAGVLDLDAFFRTGGIRVVAFDAAQASVARAAFHTYGRGRHPAGLNFGDCAAYALARSSREPLLFKGADFAQTDIAVA